MSAKLILCDCSGSMSLDKDGIEAATGLKCSRIYNSLCTSQLEMAAKEMADGDVTIACGQEAAIFQDLAIELDAPNVSTLDIRDRAGWSDGGENITPKIAALVAENALIPPPQRTMDVESLGSCLVMGKSDIAIEAAKKLSLNLDVTCVVTDAENQIPETQRSFDLYAGSLKSAAGSLGRFSVTFDGLRALEPSGRGAVSFGNARDGGSSECDVILDLSGNTPAFPAPQKRDGYLRADPGNPLAVADAIFEASQMAGTFEKPLYVSFEANLCAHSRAGQNGCDRCLNVCPTGAILANGDHVEINPNICAGCGSCAALCPSGAITYQDPPVEFLVKRINTLAETYQNAGGELPALLVHDATVGRDLIAYAARFERGLPAHVIPLEVSNLEGFGHAENLSALSAGFASVVILTGVQNDLDALQSEQGITNAILTGLNATEDRLNILELSDPEQLCDWLYADAAVAPLNGSSVLPLGNRRTIARSAVKSIAARQAIGTTAIPLPAGAPYGAVVVDTDACTLCLSCASLCPSGALTDSPDKPQLRFQQDACLQCGICASTCPENAISLLPQLDYSEAAFDQNVVNEEDPYECISCGTPFGVKSTIETIVAKLEGINPMFTDSDNANLIRMCDDCRIAAQYHQDSAPMAGKERPRVRTTDDYLNGKKPN